MNLGERIKSARKLSKMTQSELAHKCGVADITIRQYESGKRQPRLDQLERIAAALGVPAAQLLIGPPTAESKELSSSAAPIDPAHFHRIPILGYISAGLPLYAEEHIEGYTYTDLNGGAEYFALKVKGDSMNGLGINDGYQIIVRRQDEVENGEVAVVLVGDEDATVKRFYATASTVTLMPQSTNPAHQPQLYDLKKTSIKVLGKVVKVEFSL